MLWCKISSVTSSFAEWKLMWICRPQNYLSVPHFDRCYKVLGRYFEWNVVNCCAVVLSIGRKGPFYFEVKFYAREPTTDLHYEQTR